MLWVIPCVVYLTIFVVLLSAKRLRWIIPSYLIYIGLTAVLLFDLESPVWIPAYAVFTAIFITLLSVKKAREGVPYFLFFVGAIMALPWGLYLIPYFIDIPK